MTQPTSVNMTFDTSLVDLNPNASFSTTESDPSDMGTANPNLSTQQPSHFHEQSQETPKPSQATPASLPKSSTPVQHIPTLAAYNQWAAIYDLDGNMLQSIDDLQLTTLLPKFFNAVSSSTRDTTIALLDLGCGTGRNTFKLIAATPPPGRAYDITALDFSSGMLDVARKKLATWAGQRGQVRFETVDCFPTVANPSASPLPSLPPSSPSSFSGIISTLVLEHIPLAPYFATLSALLSPGGVALVTNMHADMGAVSQAGFVNADGVKVRGESFAHGVKETVEAAERAGLGVLGVWERSVEREDVETGAVGERGWKWVGVRVWYGVLLRKEV